MIDALIISLASHHFNPSHEGYREKNPGVIAEVGNWESGFYANSQHKLTLTVLYRIPVYAEHGVNFGVRLGACTGYRAGLVIPCGGASLRLGQYVDLMLVPPVHNFTPMVTAISARIPI